MESTGLSRSTIEGKASWIVDRATSQQDGLIGPTDGGQDSDGRHTRPYSGAPLINSLRLGGRMSLQQTTDDRL